MDEQKVKEVRDAARGFYRSTPYSAWWNAEKKAENTEKKAENTEKKAENRDE